MIVVGEAGKLLDLFSIRIKVHTQLCADGTDGFTRLQLVVHKIADDAVPRRGRGRSGCSVGRRSRIAVVRGGLGSCGRRAARCACRSDRNRQIENLTDADPAQVLCVVQGFQLSFHLGQVQLILAADNRGGLAGFDLMGNNLGVAAPLGDRGARNHDNLACRDMVVVGNPGKFFDFLGIRVEINAQFGADIRDGFSRLQFVVDKITDNTVAHGCRPHGRGGSGSHDSRLCCRRGLLDLFFDSVGTG